MEEVRLVDANALKEDLRRYFTDGVLDGVSAKVTFNQILLDIDNAPTIKFSLLPADESKEEAYMRGYGKGTIAGILKTNTRPQGEWITVHKQNSFGQDCICFECDKCHKYTVPIYKLMITEPLEVCPNCGCDMRGEEK